MMAGVTAGLIDARGDNPNGACQLIVAGVETANGPCLEIQCPVGTRCVSTQVLLYSLETSMPRTPIPAN